MSLPAPARTQTTDAVLFRLRALLSSSLLTDELATQQAALRTLWSNNILTLSAPTLVIVGDPRYTDTVGQMTPGIVIFSEDSEVITPDVDGDTYNIETRVNVMVCMATQDTGAVDEQSMHVTLLRYLHAIAMVMQTYAMSSTYGGLAGVYECLPITLSLSPPPIQVDNGWSLRYDMSRYLVRWQTLQPAPVQL